MINLNGMKVWGTGYSYKGKQYGDADWKEKIKLLLSEQEYVIVKGYCEKGKFNFHYNIKGFPFSLLSVKEFLKTLDKITIGYGDDVYLYDATQNEENIWSKKVKIGKHNKYIFISHTATEYQML